MPVLHRREDRSGFYLRGRIQGSWVTWQLTPEGEAWLSKSGFVDGETIDMELLDMFLDKGWAFTAGTGPGVANGGPFRPSFIKVGEGVRHAEFGIGEIKQVLEDGTCRVVFFREYPDTRVVPTAELSAARSIELARERSIAYNKALKQSAAKRPNPPVTLAANIDKLTILPEGNASRSSPTHQDKPEATGSGCLAVVVTIVLSVVAAAALLGSDYVGR